mgnify:CR=1 FL=1
MEECTNELYVINNLRGAEEVLDGKLAKTKPMQKVRVTPPEKGGQKIEAEMKRSYEKGNGAEAEKTLDGLNY